MLVRGYRPEDREPLLALWREVFADDPPHNEPARVLDAKLKVDDLIYVALEDERLMGAMMAGYDGHRGWLYSVAVANRARRAGVGTALVQHAVAQLKQLGCVKINLQVRSTNAAVVAFYESLGFTQEDRISMGMLLDSARIHD